MNIPFELQMFWCRLDEIIDLNQRELKQMEPILRAKGFFQECKLLKILFIKRFSSLCLSTHYKLGPVLGKSRLGTTFGSESTLTSPLSSRIWSI